MLTPPPELDLQFYRNVYPDLASMRDGQLSEHWSAYGIKEGRQGAATALRHGLLSLIERTDAVLEIGPFTNPTVTGPNVKYFDVLNQAELIVRARAIGYPYERAVLVDFVSSTGDLSVVPERFDVVLSCHCVEHQPDLIAHFEQVRRILNPGGRYLLVIPDKRYCFDHFIPETTLAKVLGARDRKVHARESVVEHRAHVTHNDVKRHWAGDHGRQALVDNPHLVKQATDEFETSQGQYIDVHAWQFTPLSFKSLVKQLTDAGMISLDAEVVYQTPHNNQEFCAIMRT
jgi:SAM-dependent methyltransferase